MNAATAAAQDDYVAFCRGVCDLCDLDLLDYKRGQMERRVRSFAGRVGEDELAHYLQTLSDDPRALDEFLDRVTINVSNLWRNPEQWDLLQRTIVPELAADGTLRAWSAGCSYGAEAYTLAAVCCLAAPRATTAILGTDIDRRAIARAQRGEFSAEDVLYVPPLVANRFFPRDGDLLRLPPPTGAYDLVLCRNTVIYFNNDARDALHARLAEALRPGGVLVVGATERISAPDRVNLELVAPFTYRKA
jgi:chemotaxis protein methyltransferase CheR